MIIVGIDPGKKTGMAFYSREEKKIARVQTVSFWDCAYYIINNSGSQDILFIVENPQTKAVWHHAKTRAAQNKTSVNVGSVLRESELIIDLIVLSNCKLITCPPRGKIDAEKFKLITGFDKPTNPHTRDAGMLAWTYRN